MRKILEFLIAYFILFCMVGGVLQLIAGVWTFVFPPSPTKERWTCENAQSAKVEVIMDGVEWKTTTVRFQDGTCLFEAVAP